MSSAVIIGAESAGRDDVRALLLAVRAWSAGLYPPESCHGLDLADYERPEVTLLVARSAGVAVGCGAYLLHADRSAEVKSMFVAPEARGRGIGRAILEAIEAALSGRVTTLRLETGVKQLAAIHLTKARISAAGGPSATTAPTRSACSWRNRWRERGAPSRDPQPGDIGGCFSIFGRKGEGSA